MPEVTFLYGRQYLRQMRLCFIVRIFLYYEGLFEPKNPMVHNFCRNTTQFLEKYFTVSEEIVQCFGKDV